jgi:hypothetical protein
MKSILIGLFCTLSIFAQGQIASEAELFSNNQLHGSPRFTAMGGAFTSLGNDPSAIGINPAGLAVYRKNDLSFSLGFENQQAQLGTFYGANVNSSGFNVNVENAALSFQFGDKSKSTGQFSFGIYHNTLARYNNNYNILGFNNTNTLGQYWGENSANQNVDIISNDAFAAWQAFVLVSEEVGNNNIILNENSSYAYGDYDSTSNTVTATSDVQFTYNQSGSLTETGLALGGQVENNFYYGISFNFPTLSLRREEFITEYINEQDAVAPYDLEQYTYRRLSDMYGTGFNMKLGFIYSPLPEFRIGASYQTPSWFTVRQVYDFDVAARFASTSQIENSEIFSTGEYSYRLRTPAIFRIGVSSVLAKKLILSLDYQLANPVNTTLYTNRNSYNITDQTLNTYEQQISGLFNNNQSSIAAGVEYKIKNFFLRGGYRVNQSTYTPEFEELATSALTIFSGGIGYRFGAITIDLAYTNSSFSQNLITYTTFNDQTAASEQVIDDLKTEVVNHNVIAGITYRW